MHNTITIAAVLTAICERPAVVVLMMKSLLPSTEFIILLHHSVSLSYFLYLSVGCDFRLTNAFLEFGNESQRSVTKVGGS